MQTTITTSPHHTDLIYSEQFDIRKGNILQVSEDFLNFIDQHQQLIISGNIDDDMIVSTNQKTYKLRGINLPTTLLAITQQGRIELQVSSFIKLQDYNHQYHKIYQSIKNQAGEDDEFERLTYQQLIIKHGLTDKLIKQRFRISLREFNKFQEFVDFIYYNDKYPSVDNSDNIKTRLYIPLSVLLKYMRNLMMHLTATSLINGWFTQQQLNSFDSQLYCLTNKTNQFSQSFFKLIAKKFKLESRRNQEKYRMEIDVEQKQGEQYCMKKTCLEFMVTYESVVEFVVLELAIAKQQYVSKQMDELVKDMLNVYVPLGMAIPQQQHRQSILRRIISQHFIETTKNNTSIRVFYDPLQIQSSLKGRIKFMSSFKNKFTRDQIRGVFEGMVLQDTSKQIKQLNLEGRKSIDMDDLLLKNFRKFNQLYQIKLIIPK